MGTPKNIDQIKKVINFVLDRNKELAEMGHVPVAMEIIGEAGLGKTTIQKQIADERGMHFVKLSLSQFDDLGDFTGYPTRAFEYTKDGKSEYVFEQIKDIYDKAGWTPTGESCTKWCPPKWLAGVSEPMYVLIDDWTRAQPRFQQAMMEFIDCQTYADNKLPKGSSIFLTSNPDNGAYQVNSIDPAMRTRFGSIEIRFDIEPWIEWALKNNIDGRCVNFFASYWREIMSGTSTEGSEEQMKINPRSLTKFFEMVGGVRDFDSELSQVHLLADMFLTDEVSSMFEQFVNNKLDKLPTPEEIVTGDADDIIKQLRSLFNAEIGVGTPAVFRSDIAFAVSRRITNYFKLQRECTGTLESDEIAALGKLLKVDMLFPTDINLYIAKTVYAIDRDACKAWVSDSVLRKMILKR